MEQSAQYRAFQKALWEGRTAYYRAFNCNEHHIYYQNSLMGFMVIGRMFFRRLVTSEEYFRVGDYIRDVEHAFPGAIWLSETHWSKLMFGGLIGCGDGPGGFAGIAAMAGYISQEKHRLGVANFTNTLAEIGIPSPYGRDTKDMLRYVADRRKAQGFEYHYAVGVIPNDNKTIGGWKLYREEPDAILARIKYDTADNPIEILDLDS